MTEPQEWPTTGLYPGKTIIVDTTNVAIQADQPTETPKAPQDQHDRSDTVTITSSTLGQRDVTQSDLGADSVTITISRKAAKKVADWPDDERYPFSAELGKAARAALEEER